MENAAGDGDGAGLLNDTAVLDNGITGEFTPTLIRCYKLRILPLGHTVIFPPSAPKTTAPYGWGVPSTSKRGGANSKKSKGTKSKNYWIKSPLGKSNGVWWCIAVES